MLWINRRDLNVVWLHNQIRALAAVLPVSNDPSCTWRLLMGSKPYCRGYPLLAYHLLADQVQLKEVCWMGLGTVSPLVLNLMAIAANFKTFQFQPIYYSALHIYFFLETLFFWKHIVKCQDWDTNISVNWFSSIWLKKLIFVAVCIQIFCVAYAVKNFKIQWHSEQGYNKARVSAR
jgi:hypothetical protein